MDGSTRACVMNDESAQVIALSDLRPSRSLWGNAAARIRRNRVAMMAGAVILLLAGVAVVGPLVSPYAYDSLDWQHLAVGPFGSGSHWLGTDRLGRDLFVRTSSAVRISLVISLVSTAISLAIGVTWGAVAGYVGG